MKYFILFLFFTAFVSANETFDSYKEMNERFIVDFQEDPSGHSVVILLNDGTVWRYYSKFFGLREGCLKPNLPIVITSSLSSIHGRCLMFLKGEEGIESLFVDFDFETKEFLPTVTDIADGKITLSDGSVWQERAALLYSSGYWDIGDRVIVSCLDKSTEIINVEHPWLSYFLYHHADVKFLTE